MNEFDELEARARRLAAAAPIVDEIAGTSYVSFLAAAERYAVESSAVLRIDRLPSVTHVPGASAPWLGAIALQGEIVPVTTVPALLDLPARDSENAYVLIVGEGSAAVALAVQEIDGFVSLDSAVDGSTSQHRLVQRVTSDALIVLDVAAILDDPRLWPDRRIHGEDVPS